MSSSSSSAPPDVSADVDADAVAAVGEAYEKLHAEISRVIVGQDRIITQVCACLFARGHTLLVGVPGLAKTLLVRTLSRALDLSFSRIQFTPDLMPSDITGTDIIQETADGQRHFQFVEGPIFANIVLADEINRTPPKTQAALLEAMQERHVTAGGKTRPLDAPFFVLATQNPIEQEGTYPLPEAQLDRFMFNLWLDYPSFSEEVDVVRTTTADALPKAHPVLSAQEVIRHQQVVRHLPVTDHVIEYAVGLVSKTRPDTDRAPEYVNDYLQYGAGPRASQYLILGAKALAAFDGRATPLEEDVRNIALPVLRHRIVTNFNAEADGISTPDVIERLLDA